MRAHCVLSGYTGSIVDAACSRAEDEQRIREEIGDQIGAVDYAIEAQFSNSIATSVSSEACLGYCNK